MGRQGNGSHAEEVLLAEHAVGGVDVFPTGTDEDGVGAALGPAQKRFAEAGVGEVVAGEQGEPVAAELGEDVPPLAADVAAGGRLGYAKEPGVTGGVVGKNVGGSVGALVVGDDDFVGWTRLVKQRIEGRGKEVGLITGWDAHRKSQALAHACDCSNGPA